MTDATTLVILGAGGDLTARLLLPALGQLLTREPSRAVRIVGADREEWTDADLESVVRASFASMDAEDAASRVDVTYMRTDITHPDDLRALLKDCTGQVALYFAVPPAVAAASVATLTPDMLPAGAMLVMEKPFGTDEASAEELNRTLTDLVPESQVSGRPLPRPLDHAQPPRSAVREPHPRAALVCREHRVGRHRLRRVAGAGGTRGLLRQSGRTGRHDPEPPAAGARRARDGGAGDSR